MEADAGLDSFGPQTLDYSFRYVYFILLALVFNSRMLLGVLFSDELFLKHPVYVLHLKASFGRYVLYFYVPKLLAYSHISQLLALVLKSCLPILGMRQPFTVSWYPLHWLILLGLALLGVAKIVQLDESFVDFVVTVADLVQGARLEDLFYLTAAVAHV